MMTTSDWQLFVSGLTPDEWMRRLLSAKDYALWVAVDRPDYPRFSELRGKEKAATASKTRSPEPVALGGKK
jgi:hypothetical protein